MKWIVSLFAMDILLHVIVETDASFSGWIQSLLTTDSEDIPHSRSKRSLFNFQNVIECFQPWSNVLSTYGDYGCYCGFKGHGRPLDDTDKCCYYHDKCYDAAELTATSVSQWMIGSYLTEYNFKCIDSEAICETEKNNEYQQSFCECDRAAAKCFLTNRKSYSDALYNINTKKYCGKDAVYSDLKTNSHILNKLYTCSLLDDQDRCCRATGYNSVYEMCCGGKISKLPQAFSTRTQCCHNKIYDSTMFQCCHGYLHPKSSHISCCGTQGEAIDATIFKCVDGKSVPLQSNTQNLDKNS